MARHARIRMEKKVKALLLHPETPTQQLLRIITSLNDEEDYRRWVNHPSLTPTDILLGVVKAENVRLTLTALNAGVLHEHEKEALLMGMSVTHMLVIAAETTDQWVLREIAVNSTIGEVVLRNENAPWADLVELPHLVNLISDTYLPEGTFLKMVENGDPRYISQIIRNKQAPTSILRYLLEAGMVEKADYKTLAENPKLPPEFIDYVRETPEGVELIAHILVRNPSDVLVFTAAVRGGKEVIDRATRLDFRWSKSLFDFPLYEIKKQLINKAYKDFELDPEEIGQDYMARVLWGENWREGFDYLHKLITDSVIF